MNKIYETCLLMTQGGRERASLVSFSSRLDFIPRAKGTGKGAKPEQAGWG